MGLRMKDFNILGGLLKNLTFRGEQFTKKQYIETNPNKFWRSNK